MSLVVFFLDFALLEEELRLCLHQFDTITLLWL